MEIHFLKMGDYNNLALGKKHVEEPWSTRKWHGDFGGYWLAVSDSKTS